MHTIHDWGCGDGRVVALAAAAFGARAVGWERDQQLLAVGQELQSEVSEERITLIKGSFLSVTLLPADRATPDVVFYFDGGSYASRYTVMG